MAENYDFTGTWHSINKYTSTAKPGQFTSEYDVEIHRAGNQIVIQSVKPDKEGAYVLLRLTLDGRILTGTWHESTSPIGDYSGEERYGAIQLILSDDGNVMRGKWVGFNRKMYVQTDDWEIVRTNKEA